MSDIKQSLWGTLLPLVVVGLAAWTVERFVLPLVWAVILCIATWPLYARQLQMLHGRALTAALITTTLVATLLMVPAAVAVREAIAVAPAVGKFVVDANTNGLPAPALLARIPLGGEYLQSWWQTTLAQPHGLSHVLSEGPGAVPHSPGALVRTFGILLMHRLIDFGFAMLCLFFFYKDGLALHQQIVRLGGTLFGSDRWARYYDGVPTAVRATVNGLVLVGLGEGVLIGIGYAIAGLPSPALWAAATGILGIVPFGALAAFLIAAAVLAAQGATAAAAGVVAWGAVVLFVADHFVRPTLIGNATRLPFLAVLFGILGGVEAFGLVGLFVGPVIMVLFLTLWREADDAS